MSLKVKQQHITKPGKMTIVSVADKVDFVPDIVVISSELEAGSIYLACPDKLGIGLKKISALSLPDKVYDFEQDFRNQILKTLRDPSSNMNIGVLLEGYKGQGKSVIAKQLAIESGLPVIIINQSIPKEHDFVSFLGNIKQDHVLLIDEFEKLFKNHSDNENPFHTQDSFLSFLDGALNTNHKRLVIFTANDEIGDKFINRPSRIRYYKKFNFMSKQTFEAIVQDKLKNKKFRKDLEENLNIPTCTIDILTTIIEEINLHKKPYSAFKDFFNHKQKDTVYTIYKQTERGNWEWIEDRKVRKEIGIEGEYFNNAFGWNAVLETNDGEVIIFEKEEEIEDENGKEVTKKFKYKAKKEDFSLSRATPIKGNI